MDGAWAWLECWWVRLWMLPWQDAPVDIVRDPPNDADDKLPTLGARDDRDDRGAEETLDRLQRVRLSSLQAVTRVLVGDDISVGDLIDAAAYVATGDRVPPLPADAYRAMRESPY